MTKIKTVWLVAIAWVNVSCHFEGNYEMDAYFPVTVNFININASKINIESITNTVNSTSIFLVEGKSLQGGETISTRFNHKDADAIRDGLYTINGRCTNDLDITSADSTIVDTDYEDKAVLIVEIGGCS